MKFLLLLLVFNLHAQDAAKGKKVYNNCIACHGAKAEGKVGMKAPKLATQWSWYTEKQLKDIKSKKRDVPIMIPYVNSLTEQDIKDVSKFLEDLK